MATPTQPPVLVSVATLIGADYNPRKVIPERLEQVKMSLTYLGFLLPLYATKDNRLLSGHQRITAARILGYTHVPVVYLSPSEAEERGLNLVFNKATNDLDTFSESARESFDGYINRAESATDGLTPIEPNTHYPCMDVSRLPIRDLLPFISGVGDSLRNAGSQLHRANVSMPIVMSGGKIINGLGRLAGYYTRQQESVDVVEIPEGKAGYAYLALNFLAMDFDIQSNFKQELRYNAFRRKAVQSQIVGLSRTFGYFVYARALSNTRGKWHEEGNLDLKLLPTYSKATFKKFKDEYGATIFDMGAGTLHDSNLMKSAGLDCTPFEPYYSPPGESVPNPEASRKLNSDFLDKFKSVKLSGPTSLISSFVLNSIPHHEDRMAYLCILGAMSRMTTTLYIGTQSTKVLKGTGLSHQMRMNGVEKNMTLGNNNKFFKAQKFFEPEELFRMVSMFFSKVELAIVEQNLYVKATMPRRANPQMLREALELEFDLPYEDGSTMGLKDKAIEIFSEYLGVPL